MKYQIILYLFLLGIAAVGYLNDPTVTLMYHHKH
jgi:hypothetical protein